MTDTTPANAQELLNQAEGLSRTSTSAAIAKAKLAYSAALDANDQLTRLKSLIMMGRCSFMSGHTGDAIKWLLECISTADTLNMPEQMAEAFNQLGNTYLVIKDYGRSISCYLDALDIMKDNGFQSMESRVLNNIGALYLDLEDLDHAADYFQQSYEMEASTSQKSVILLLNLASIYAKKKAFEKADFYMKKAQEALTEPEDLLMLSWFYLTDGEVAQAKDDIESAIKHYKAAFDMLSKTGDAFNECDMSIRIGLLLLEAGRCDEALEVLLQTYEKCNMFKVHETSKKIAGLIARCYSNVGEDEKALRFYILQSMHTEQSEKEHIENQRKSVLLQVQQHETNLERLRLKQLSEELMRTTDELKEAYATLERQAIIDSLTGIRNRRSMDALLDSTWKQCQDESLPFTLMLVDLDCFKNFNDYYGHPAGDENLRIIASCLTEAIGDERLIGRYGGDEFVAVLPDISGEEARSIGNKMLDNVRSKRIKHERNDASSIQTVTVGAICLVPGRDDAPGSALHMADTALYDGKKQGKDRLVLYCRE